MNRLVAILFYLLPASIWAQQPCWQQIPLEGEIDIQEMHIDSLGFLWLVDKQNVYRFDGKEAIAKLELEDEQITTSDYYTHKILIGTSYGRILKMDLTSDSLFVLQDSLHNDPVTEIHYVDDENFIYASYGSGICIVNKFGNKKLDVNQGLVSNEVYDIELHSNRFYLATDQGIQILNPENPNSDIEVIDTDDGLSDIVVTHLISQDDKLWYTDYDKHLGSISINHVVENFALEDKSKINDVIALNNEVFLVSDNGLTTYSDGQFINQYPISGTDKISIIQNDKEGNLWMVNSGGNLLKGNLYFQKLNIQTNSITAFTMLDDNYIIGSSEGLYRYKEKLREKINSNNITHLIKYKDYLIVGTFSQGLKVYNDRMILVQHIEGWSDYNGQSVLHLYSYKERLYVSSLTGVVEFRFMDNGLRIVEDFNDLIGPGYIYTIVSDSEKMYFGTDRKGLIVLDKKSKDVKEYPKFSSGDKVGSIYSMTIDNRGVLWFGSENQGLGYLERDKLIAVKDIKNLSDRYTSMSTTSSGYMLAIRGSSIDLINPHTKHIMYYNKELDINDQKTYLNTIYNTDEESYFAHGNNVYRYAAETNIKIHPSIVIDQILVNLTPVTRNQSFDEDQNNIEFSFLGSWLTDPSKLSYQYLLEGYDDQWRDTKDESISFRNLPPGEYNFKVRGSENGYFSDEPEASYDFEIKSHFYNLPWVRGILILLIGLLAWSIIKVIEGRKKEKLALEKLNLENQFINLKNQLNPHFLFNAFNTLIGLIEEDSERSVAFVEGMTDFYRNMLEYGKKNLISLDQEIEMLNQYIAILKARFNGQLDIQIDLHNNIEDYKLPPMTLQLLLENAVKHNVVSTKKPLKFNIDQKADKIVIRNIKNALVQDAKGTKTGLENIKRRFELVGLSTPIINHTNTYFEVTISLMKSHE